MNERPNIILILADDMGYECLSNYGSASYYTPNIDKMAANGVRFTNCYSQPLCTPSRVKIMTGKYNFRNYEAFGYLNPKEKTFGNLLKDAGYRTCVAGKWQLNGKSGQIKYPGWEDVNRPNHFGFEEYCLWQLQHDGSEGGRYSDPLIVQNGKDLPRDKDTYGPDVFCNFILDFIGKKENKPFFVYYPMVLTHSPFVPTPDSKSWEELTERNRDNIKYFKDMVEYTDRIIGRIMDKLNETGQLENTIIIFTGDNGTNDKISSKMLDGRIVKGEKGKMTDGGTKVPLVVYWKGKSSVGVVNEDLINFTDFLPTLAQLAGETIPSGWTNDGVSFLPQILGKNGKPKQYLYMYYRPEWGGRKNGVFVRNKKYKLYGDDSFFNVEQDVLEEKSLDIHTLYGEELAAYKKLKSNLKKFPKINDEKN